MKTKSKYARVFDSSCANWDKDQYFNRLYLRSQEIYFNDMLRARGYVFLRDVYECLGFPLTRTSLFVGWYDAPANAFGGASIAFGVRVRGGGAAVVSG